LAALTRILPGDVSHVSGAVEIMDEVAPTGADSAYQTLGGDVADGRDAWKVRWILNETMTFNRCCRWKRCVEGEMDIIK